MPREFNLEAAKKHYASLKKAQKAYYDKKHPIETRRPRGRPRKTTSVLTVPIPEGVVEPPTSTPPSCPPPNVAELLHEAYTETKNPLDWVPARELIDYLRSRGVCGSDTKVGLFISSLGFASVCKKLNGKSLTVRVGLVRRQPPAP